MPAGLFLNFGEGKRKVRGMDEGTKKKQNPKCRLYWCLIEFIDWRYRQSCWCFRLNADPDPIRIQSFDDQEMKNIYSCKKFDIFFIKNFNPYASTKYVQATGEAFSQGFGSALI